MAIMPQIRPWDTAPGSALMKSIMMQASPSKKVIDFNSIANNGGKGKPFSAAIQIFLPKPETESGNGLIALGNRQAQVGADGLVVLLGELRRILDGHLGDVRFAGENLDGHLAGGDTQIIVADG